MTETKEPMTAEEKKEPISVETRKVIQGISLVFSGVVTMLEALHPHVSLEPSALLHLITGNVEGLEAMATEKRAEEAEKETEDQETKAADAGTVAASAVEPSSAAPVDDDVAPKAAKPKTQEPPEMATQLTQDDITRVIVQKLRQNRSNNEKIGQLLKAHGVAKVSELPAEKYEAFLTDLSAI